MNEDTEIGKIINVSGNDVTVKLLDKIKSNLIILDGITYKIGQIGSFVKIPLGYCNLYGIVTQVGADALNNIIDDSLVLTRIESTCNRWITVTLIGEQIANHFERGLSQTPTTDDIVHLVTIEDLKVIYNDYDDNSTIKVGTISSSEELPALLDLDKLVSRHFAVLGSTGSGKSNAIGVLLNAILQEDFPRARIIILDPHGEYGSVFNNNANVVVYGGNQKPLYVPYWAVPFEELLSIFSVNIGINKDYLRDKIIEYKRKGAVVNNISINENLITADSPIPYSIKQLWFDLMDFENRTYSKGQNNKLVCKMVVDIGDANNMIPNIYPEASTNNSEPFKNPGMKNIKNFLLAMKSRIMDIRYSFLFSPGPYTPNLDGKVESDLASLLELWLGTDNRLKIIDLSDVPYEIMSSISGTMLNLIYDALFWGQNLDNGGKKQPLLIVLEEAHNYLKSGMQSISARNIQRIAKEGRKYGVGLALVTQRPSELDETVLSQCGTIIALRMNNSKDCSFVSNAMQDELKSLVKTLSSLRTGEALVSGEGVRIPSKIKFDKLDRNVKGADPKIIEEWSKKISNNDNDYASIVELWRNKKFNMEEK